MMKENFDAAIKVGRPAARQASEAGHSVVVSECPLARDHIMQGMEKITDEGNARDLEAVNHPIQVLAKAYGLEV